MGGDWICAALKSGAGGVSFIVVELGIRSRTPYSPCPSAEATMGSVVTGRMARGDSGSETMERLQKVSMPKLRSMSPARKA